MMVLSAMCGIIAVFVLMMRSLPQKRRIALLAVEICAMFIMIADCLAYAYRGNPSETGYWVVRDLTSVKCRFLHAYIRCKDAPSGS